MPAEPPVHSRWKKGQSGNPGGRPRGKPVTDLLRQACDSKKIAGKDVGGSLTLAQRVALGLCDLAFNPQTPPQVRLQALVEIITRIEGRAEPVPHDMDANPYIIQTRAFLEAIQLGPAPQRRPSEMKELSDG